MTTSRRKVSLHSPPWAPRKWPSSGTYQSMERGDWQDAQPAKGQLGGAAGSRQETLRVWQLPALQAGQIAAHPEQVHVKFLQVLFPLLDLFKQEQGGFQYKWEVFMGQIENVIPFTHFKEKFVSVGVAWLKLASPAHPISSPSARTHWVSRPALHQDGHKQRKPVVPIQSHGKTAQHSKPCLRQDAQLLVSSSTVSFPFMFTASDLKPD